MTGCNFNFDVQHTGNSVAETALGSGNVSTLHRLFHVALPDTADGAPTYLSDVSTPSGTRDLLFLTTRDGHILALDAHTGAEVWSHQNSAGFRCMRRAGASIADPAHTRTKGIIRFTQV